MLCFHQNAVSGVQFNFSLDKRRELRRMIRGAKWQSSRRKTFVCPPAKTVVYLSQVRSAAITKNKTDMPATIEESPVLQKTRELCQTILDQPNMQSIRRRIDAFLGDEKHRPQYDGL